MLTDANIVSGGHEVPIGSEEWLALLNQIAAEHPKSTAAHILHLVGFAWRLPFPWIREGVYEVSNFGNLLRESGFIVHDYPETDAMASWTAAYKRRLAESEGRGLEDLPVADREPLPSPPEFVSSYGVADDLDQVLGYLAPFVQHPEREFAIAVRKLRRDVKNLGAGWRWRKAGPYVGKREPEAEYLNDEPLIEEVTLFHVHEFLPDPEPTPGSNPEGH